MSDPFLMQAIPSMRPSTTTEKPLVLGQPPSPGSSRHSTPQSAGGLQTGGFGPHPGAFAPAHDAAPYGAPRDSRGASRGGGSPPRRASAVSLGGARRSTHADGRPREWDESSSSDGDD